MLRKLKAGRRIDVDIQPLPLGETGQQVAQVGLAPTDACRPRLDHKHNFPTNRLLLQEHRSRPQLPAGLAVLQQSRPAYYGVAQAPPKASTRPTPHRIT